MWSSLHYPVGILPAITTVQPNEQHYEDKFNDIYTTTFNADAKNSTGMPVTVGVVGHPWEDELVLGVMKTLSEQISPISLPIIEA